MALQLVNVRLWLRGVMGCIYVEVQVHSHKDPKHELRYNSLYEKNAILKLTVTEQSYSHS